VAASIPVRVAERTLASTGPVWEEHLPRSTCPDRYVEVYRLGCAGAPLEERAVVASRSGRLLTCLPVDNVEQCRDETSHPAW
jgi:hypothetical protein